jgi:hypothetical protein
VADRLDSARVLRALARPGIGDELRALGVRDLSAFGPDDYEGEAQWPPWNEARIRELVDEEAVKREVKGEPGRPRVLVTKATLLEIFKQSLERARDTAEPPRPYYQQIATDNGVKRTWVTPIVKWVAAHQQEALHAVATSEIPPRFSTCVRN